jgi:hypothetical protein
MSKATKQVKFGCYGDPRADGYFRDIQAIADFIGAKLQHPRPPCNGRNPRVSTIHVDQSKEKFGHVRVYCSLAATAEVEAKWAEFGREGQPDEAFYSMCLKHDARYYRRTFYDMVRLVPHYRDAILDAADHQEALSADGASLHAHLDNVGAPWVETLCRCYRVADRAALEAWLCDAYDDRAAILEV